MAVAGFNWAAQVALLLLGVTATFVNGHRTTLGPGFANATCSGNVTIVGTTTIITAVTEERLYIVNTTRTSTTEKVETSTRTDVAVVTSTKTDLTTITNTEVKVDTSTTTATVSSTVTNTLTTTVMETKVDPCPSSCSVSAETVNLYFWPTDRPHSYPTTYVHPSLSYTFTSPSVYMRIPTIVGTNTLNQTVGPSTTQWILPLDLTEVSTIIGTRTEQLHLSDLGTDCPQTADPTAIATMVDSRCDPILAAPMQVREWAWPCNACGPFGLFDPPYAVPTITGGLVRPTVTAVPEVTPTPAPSSAAPAPSPQPPASSQPPTSSLAPSPAPAPSSSRPVQSSSPAPQPSSSIPPSPSSAGQSTTSGRPTSSIVPASAQRLAVGYAPLLLTAVCITFVGIVVA